MYTQCEWARGKQDAPAFDTVGVVQLDRNGRAAVVRGVSSVIPGHLEVKYVCRLTLQPDRVWHVRKCDYR